MQHALRAFTPNDQKALRATVKTFPNSDLYDLEETLTTLGIGEALVTVLSARGVPSPPFATRLVPPSSRMAPLTEAELQQRLAASPQVKRYRDAIDRESAEEKLADELAPKSAEGQGARRGSASDGRTARAAEPGTLERVLRSPVTRSVAVTVAGAITRGILGAILGPTRRRTRR